MRWTCPKCGKKLDISNEQLMANDGVIVCPQCLLQARQPIPKTRVAARSTASATPPPHKTSSTSSTPPPHRTPMKQANTSYRYTGIGGKTGTAKKKTTKKKSKKKKQSGMSAWGCMGRTIIFTLLLFAAYIFFGLLLESFQ